MKLLLANLGIDDFSVLTSTEHTPSFNHTPFQVISESNFLTTSDDHQIFCLHRDLYKNLGAIFIDGI